MNVTSPLDAAVFAWRDGDDANKVRLVARTNLSATASPAPETVAIKLAWLRDVGVRADAAATGGDIPPGQVVIVNTCVGADLIGRHDDDPHLRQRRHRLHRRQRSATLPAPAA